MPTTGLRLAKAAERLSKLLDEVPDDDTIVDTLDYLVGAVYSMFKIEGLPFWERHGPRFPGYKEKLSTYVRDMPIGSPPGEYWLSGYFFNSAIQRVAACYDRMPKLVLGIKDRDPRSAHKLMAAAFGDESKYANWRAVYLEVNPLKHSPAGLAQKREVGKEDAVRALEEILSLLEASKPKLANLYS